MKAHELPLPAILLFAGVFAFGMIRRMRSHVGRQRLHRHRLRARTLMLVVGCGLLLAAAAHRELFLIAEIAGLVLGAALALFSLRLTRFEADGGNRYYTPNLYIGLGLTLLFMARIVYRLLLMWPTLQAGQLPQGNPWMGGVASGTPVASAVTAALLLAMLGYYLCYYAGLLRHAAVAVEAPPADLR